MSRRLSHCAALVRGRDIDRFLSTLFAPAGQREALFALYAFDQEIGRTPERVSEPGIGLIRLQWWRETVEAIEHGTVRPHPVAEALAPPVRDGLIAPGRLLAALDGRESEMEDPPPADETELRARLRAIHAPVFAAALDILGAAGPSADGSLAGTAGEAWGLAELCRRVGRHSAAGRRWLPDAVMRTAGAREADLFAGRATDGVLAAWEATAGAAQEALAEAEIRAAGLPRTALPALMPLSLADQALERQRRRRGEVLRRPLEPGRPAKQWRLIRCARRGRLVLRAATPATAAPA